MFSMNCSNCVNLVNHDEIVYFPSKDGFQCKNIQSWNIPLDNAVFNLLDDSRNIMSFKRNSFKIIGQSGSLALQCDVITQFIFNENQY